MARTRRGAPRLGGCIIISGDYIAMPTINDNPCVELAISLPRPAPELDRLLKSLPKLEKEMNSNWPISSVRLRLRNPYRPSELEVSIAIALASWLAQRFADEIRDEAYGWLKRRFKRLRQKTSRRAVGRRRR
jgi:hypothetical protein